MKHIKEIEHTMMMSEELETHTLVSHVGYEITESLLTIGTL
jgi:hypothetical protein